MCMRQTIDVSPPGAGPFLCIATYLPLAHWRHLFAFIKLSNRVAAQMKKTPGVVRFGLRANLFRKQFWTCSVWRAEGAEFAVQDFVEAGVHRHAVAAFPKFSSAAEAFTRWTSDSAEIDWPEALRRLAGAGH